MDFLQLTADKMDSTVESHTSDSSLILELTQGDADKSMDSPNHQDTSDSDTPVSSSPHSPAAPGDDVILDVECGLNKGVLYLNRLSSGSKGACVLFDNAWLTPNEFQYVSGRETAKDWKRSIKHYGKSLKLLIAKGFMTTDPASCKCEGCVVTDDKSEHVHRHPEANQENVPPGDSAQDASCPHTPEVEMPDKDKTRPEVADSHVTGSAGSEGKASLEISERPVLQSLVEDLVETKVEAAKKAGKKRKSQSKATEKPKKHRKRSHDVKANPTVKIASEATVDDINGEADQSSVPVSVVDTHDGEDAMESRSNSSPITETMSDERQIKAAPESSPVNSGNAACFLAQAHIPRNTPEMAPSSTLRHSGHTLTNPEVSGVNEVHTEVDSLAGQTDSSKDNLAEGITAHNDGFQPLKTASQVTGQTHQNSDGSLVANNRSSQMETLPAKSDSAVPVSLDPHPSAVIEPESVLPPPPARHAHSFLATDMTSFQPEAEMTQVTPESEMIPARRSPLHNDSEVGDSAPIVPPAADQLIHDASENGSPTENEPQPTSASPIRHDTSPPRHVSSPPRHSSSPSPRSSPGLHVDIDQAGELDASDESLPLSPRKEARLTCIIAELKSYKKQLIERIEGQKITDDFVDDEDQDNDVKVTDPDQGNTQADVLNIQPDDVDMTPTLVDTTSGHVDTQPDHVDTQPDHVNTQPGHVDTQPCHVKTQPDHVNTQPGHMETQPDHVNTQPGHMETQPDHVKTQPDHVDNTTGDTDTVLKGDIPLVVNDKESSPADMTNTKTKGDDKLEPSQKCRTLYHILSSGNLPDSFKSTAKNNNHNNNNNNNNNNGNKTTLVHSTPDSQPLKSTFEKKEVRLEDIKSKAGSMSYNRDNKERKKDTFAKASSDKKATNHSPPVSHVMTSLTAPVASPMTPIPSSMYLAPPLFPFPYGIPPGYLYPGGLYGGFPFPDPTAIYKSLAASHALPAAAGTTSSSGFPIPSPFKGHISSSGHHSLVTSNNKTDTRPSSKISKKEKIIKSKSSHPPTGSNVRALPPNVTAGSYMPMFSPFGIPDMTYMSTASKVAPVNGHFSKSAKSLPSTTVTEANRKSKTSASVRTHNKSHEHSGALDLSVKKRPSIPSRDAYSSSKRPCHEPGFHTRNGMILDLSKTSAR